MKVALITGITGQDGSYLAELLLEKGYEVHGTVRRSSQFNTRRIDHLHTFRAEPNPRFFLHYADLSDGTGMRRLLTRCKPNEVYNLAAQSHVRISFDQPEYTADVVATGTLRLLEALRDYCDGSGQEVRFYQAGSSEMYGSAPAPQSETTRFWPRSPYAVAKVAAFYYGVNFRESYQMFVANGILFNHESPRRGENFVTRKITIGATRIQCGLQDKLVLGNLDARRDWGFAGDYVEAMWRMLQQDTGDDYVVATGESYSVRDFLTATFSQLGLDWEKYVRFDEAYTRPAEVDHLQGDASKARKELGWAPQLSFQGLVKLMVDEDMKLAEKDRVLQSL
jgi:GDPmannose 4,6-dehydratase